MTRNLKILLAALAVLGLTTMVVVMKNGKSTISKAQGRFAVADTAAITSIRIERKQGESVLLQRIENKWFANNNIPTRTDLPPLLLKVLHDIDKTKIVSKSESERIRERMNTDGYHITVMARNKQLTDYQYYFDSTKTCYAYKGGKVYTVSVTGYGQLMGIMQLTSATDWRSHAVFAVSPTDISQIIFNDEEQPENSFSISRSGHDFNLSSYPIGLKINNIDEEKLHRFIGQFKRKNFIEPANMTSQQTDSMKCAKPIFTISVTNTAGQEFWCKAYKRMNEKNETDYDNFYLQISSGDFVIAKYFEFDPIIKSKNYFIKSN